MKKRLMALGLLTVMSLLLCSCGEEPSLSAKEDVICIKVDESYTINVAQTDGEQITWSSRDTSVATVSPEGTVTGVGNGTTTIKLKTKNGYDHVGVVVESDTGYIDGEGNYIPAFTQQSNITEIVVGVKGGNKSDVTVRVGDVLQLKAYTTPQDSTDKITWHVDNASKAYVSVDEDGKVHIKAKGNATVTAYAPNGVSGKILLRCK